MPIENDTLLRALRREPVDHVPVWLMRQAGRYLPEYAALRARAGSFMTLATTPSLATEVTLQPLARFPLDAAILFSDILTVPDAMGLGLSFAEGEGPRFERAIADEASIAALESPDLARLSYVFDAVAQIKRALAGRVPLIGFAGSPFTLACYMIEGGSSDDFATVRKMAFARPDLLDRIVAVNTRAVAGYLREQLRAGADALMLFDTWGGLLSEGAYRRFSLEPMCAVLREMPVAAPTILFTKGRTGSLASIAGSGASCMGLDWTADLRDARRRHGARVAIQGNLDPLALLTDPRTIEAAVADLLRAAGPEPGYVFNLGHGIVPATPPDNVAALVAAVHQHSRKSLRGAGPGAAP
ncbi:MAG TPA: uroporphyrinogen decarboxylase [Casimicrobiaceae bacterium]|nr:uroporphyrinogen decarboxylase [Casimicrobiaceae bacterium]